VLVNRRSGRVLAEHVEIANTFWKRATGLMFRRRFDGALIFPDVGRTSFHGFFCFFPILLVCLDEQNRVKETKVLRPWSVLDVDCKTVIELDARNHWDVKKGDELVWNEGSRQ